MYYIMNQIEIHLVYNVNIVTVEHLPNSINFNPKPCGYIINVAVRLEVIYDFSGDQ